MILLKDVIAIAGTILLNASAQIFLRAAMRGTDLAALLTHRDVGGLLGVAFDVNLLSGLGCYVVSVLLWLYVLSHLPVGVAYPFMSLAYVVTVIFGWALLDEQLSALRLAGVFLICLGVWVVARSA